MKLSKYCAIAIVAVPLSIISHELGHFFAYQFFGAGSVRLHAFSVSADKEALSNMENGLAAIIGLIISYATIALAAFFTRKEYRPFWIILALAAPIGRVVNFVYLYFRMAGYDPSPNFDEFNFSRNIAIEPVFISIFTGILVIAIFGFFFKKAWQEGGISEIGALFLSLAVGLAAWSMGGEYILP